MLAQKSGTSKELDSSVGSDAFLRTKSSGSEWNYVISSIPWKSTGKEYSAYEPKRYKLHVKYGSQRPRKRSNAEDSMHIRRQSKSFVGNKFGNIEEALASAKHSLLSLQTDWDEAGSPGYTEETWERMSSFLLNQSKHLAATYGVETPTPKILPGPNGSIDLLWKHDKYELLLNIPADSKTPASFYGDDKGSFNIKGKLDPTKINQGLLQWLMSHQTP